MVNTINLIPPRGCAFVCMNRRMDAAKALKSLHKHKLQGKPITVGTIIVPPPARECLIFTHIVAYF